LSAGPVNASAKCRRLTGSVLYDDLLASPLDHGSPPGRNLCSCVPAQGHAPSGARSLERRGAASRLVRRGGHAVHQHGSRGIGDLAGAPHDCHAVPRRWVLLGPRVSGLLHLNVVTHASALERVTALAVIVSLFTAGLKLRVPVLDRRWLIAVRLAVASMAITVALVAMAIVTVLGWPWGVGIIVGAILVPTDPVLASECKSSTHSTGPSSLRADRRG